MSPKIGFIVLAHDKPRQLLRLMRRLIDLYDNPPIVCHFNFGIGSLEGLEFPREVRFVRPHVDTKWARISCCHAFHAALREMYRTGDAPDWFVFLSGSDYPTRTASEVLDQLANGGFDGYLDYRTVVHPFVPDPSKQYDRFGCNSAHWVPIAYDRYVATQAWLPGYSWSRKKLIRIPLGFLRSKLLVRLLTPFSDTLQCYGGDAWLTGNRRVAEQILERSVTNRRILAHFAKRFAPDESLTHTLLCNSSELKISTDSLRYIDWSQGGHHPKVLGIEDVPKIIASKAHFARKFDTTVGTDVLDAIDRAIDNRMRHPEQPGSSIPL